MNKPIFFYLYQNSPAMTFYRGTQNNRVTRTIRRIPNVRKHSYPTEKPVEVSQQECRRRISDRRQKAIFLKQQPIEPQETPEQILPRIRGQFLLDRFEKKVQIIQSEEKKKLEGKNRQDIRTEKQSILFPDALRDRYDEDMEYLVYGGWYDDYIDYCCDYDALDDWIGTMSQHPSPISCELNFGF